MQPGRAPRQGTATLSPVTGGMCIGAKINKIELGGFCWNQSFGMGTKMTHGKIDFMNLGTWGEVFWGAFVYSRGRAEHSPPSFEDGVRSP